MPIFYHYNIINVKVFFDTPLKKMIRHFIIPKTTLFRHFIVPKLPFLGKKTGTRGERFWSP
jgi:hypothetical protein